MHIEKKRVALVTGATSGIGYDTAKLLAEAGYAVYGAGRKIDALRPLEPLGVKAVRMDLTDAQSIDDGVKQVLEQAGRIDVLVNNAGYGSLGPLENVTIDEARRQFDVNVFGLIALTQRVLPVMRQQGSGRIVNVSSIAGRVVSLMGGWYHASKFALEALSDALRREVKPFGVKVVIIEPGAIKTAWAEIAGEHLEQSSQGTIYAPAASRAAAFMRKLYGGKLPAEPIRVARTIVRAVTVPHPKARYRVGFSSTSQLWLKALLPTKLLDKIFTSL